MCSSRVDISPSHWTQPSMIAVHVFHYLLATTRIAADGNIFFRSVSLAVNESQEFHEELCLLITMYMIHKSTNPQRSVCGKLADQGCRLWGLGLRNWRSLQHAASLLNITIFYTCKMWGSIQMAQAFTTGN